MKSRGLIIMGYPGIGKTTLANSDSPFSRVIDFESSMFNMDYLNNKRVDDWQVVYCKQAYYLAKQGFIVLISSHECVRKELTFYTNESDVSIVSIVPSPLIVEEWIEKLYNRYSKQRTAKNENAWKHASEKIVCDIHDIASDPSYSCIFLNDTDYDLRRIVDNLYDIYVRGHHAIDQS